VTIAFEKGNAPWRAWRYVAHCWLCSGDDEQVKYELAFMPGRTDFLQRRRNIDARVTFCAVSVSI